MLSRIDIEKEIGKGICLQPFHPQNIKENSINLTVSHFAWTTKGGRYIKNKDDKYVVSNVNSALQMKKGDCCVVKHHGKQKVLLFPHQTTIIETSEVIGVADYIGGTLHSKIGVVAQGIGHIGTMLGPGYCGHMMISLHNITDEIITLTVGDTFISLTLYYLNRAVERTSTTISGHVDKLSELGVNCEKEIREALTADWKSNFKGICEHMEQGEAYKTFKKNKDKEKWKNLEKYFNLKNIIIIVVIAIIFVGLYWLACYIDAKSGNSIWTDRYWNVGFSGVLVTVISVVKNWLTPSKK